MAPKLFLTGVTGYIGGHVLDTLVAKHPEYEYTVMLRRQVDGFAERYPKVAVVQGDFDSSDVIRDAASKADIVVHSGNSDHEASITALLAGLESRKQLSFLIHLGGTGIVADVVHGRVGELNPRIWSDEGDIDEIWRLPDPSLHRNVDKIIQQTASDTNSLVKTAIMCPPDIYGRSRSLGGQQSYFTPLMLEQTTKYGATFYTNSGANTKSWVHLDDLASLYVSLVEAAANGGAGAEWGLTGYYFTGSQELSQRQIAERAGEILHAKGLLASATPKQVPLEELNDFLADRGMGPFLPLYLFASNSRTRADRARRLFGYAPTGVPSYLDAIEADIDDALSGQWKGRLI